MVCLIDSTNQKSIGVIQNATWNYYTNGSGVCKTINKPAMELSSFKNVTSLKGKKGLELKLNPKTVYQLEWYNPLTGKNIDSIVTVISNRKGKISLMHPVLTNELPFVAFKVYTKDSPFKKPKNNKIIRQAETPEILELPKNKPLEIQEK